MKIRSVLFLLLVFTFLSSSAQNNIQALQTEIDSLSKQETILNNQLQEIENELVNIKEEDNTPQN